jgi:PhnB protein
LWTVTALPFRSWLVDADEVVTVQPELWIERAGAAVEFYKRAFGATVEHRVGDGDDIVAQLSIGDARFWVATASPNSGRLDPSALGGATGRILLVVDDPDSVVERAVAAGATEKSPASDEHGWRVARITDPFGHEWELGTPLGQWPPNS